MAVEARCFLDGRACSAHFADFVPQKMKHVALIAACPSVGGPENSTELKRQAAAKQAQARENRSAFRAERRSGALRSTTN